MGFWREVFDFRDETQTPARVKATVQVAIVLGVLGGVGVLAVGIASDWHSPIVINLSVIPVIAAGLSVSSAIRLRRLRRDRRQSRGTRRSRPASPRDTRCQNRR